MYNRIRGIIQTGKIPNGFAFSNCPPPPHVDAQGC